MNIRPFCKTFGGKFYIWQWVVSHFPENYRDLLYYELYGGGASVLLNKPRSIYEVYGDKNQGLASIAWWLTNRPKELIDRVRLLPYTEEVFQAALRSRDSQTGLNAAVSELVIRRFSRGGLKEKFSYSTRDRGGRPGDENAWVTFVREEIVRISNRMSGVGVFHALALEVMKSVVTPKNCLFYLDPPYLPKTRVAKEAYGDDEMSFDDHVELLDFLVTFPGKVLLSGYASTLYDSKLAGWSRVTRNVANRSGQGQSLSRRGEVLWANYPFPRTP